MKKSVLIIMVLCVLGGMLLPVYALADFFNNNLLKKRTEEIRLGKNAILRAALDIPDSSKTAEIIPFDPSPFGMKPPKDYTKPIITFSDSIQYSKSRVKQMREIQGLKLDTHAFIPIDEYLKKSLDDNFMRKWNDPKKRLDILSGKEGRSDSDLSFALPVGERFSQIVGGDTKLLIDGTEKITFSGRSEWTEGQIETSMSKNSSFPSLTMKQEPSFSIRGQVGDRISVDIKQDPSMGPMSNIEENISLKYQGKDNEIIKYIEAGNTSLTLEGATFAGYRGSHKGLFGIRTENQLGPLKVTAIASQEKSEANVKSFRGSAEETSTQIRDYEYKANTYFFLDYDYRSLFADGLSFNRIGYNPADSLVYIEVYADDGIIGNNLNENTLALRGVAVPMDLATGENPDAANSAIEGYYHRLDPARDYYVDRSLGFIQFRQQVSDEWTIGVYIETKDGREFGNLNYDTNDENSKIRLKLIKPKKQRPTDIQTWDLEWKNVYNLGQQMIEPEGLDISIKREATDGNDTETQNGTPYIQIFGLDKNDELGNETPDNKIDLNRGFINFQRGELILPLLKPFNTDASPPGVSAVIKKEDRIPSIYESQNRDEKVEASKFYIEVKTANRQSTMQISTSMGGIMEGTEEVMLNGKKLARGTDYRIDYFSGKLTLLNEEAMAPTADLSVRFEEANAFQQMQKTLLGVRGEYDLFSNSKIGSVVLFKNESTKDKRVKLGSEPSRTLLFDADALFNFESRRVTSVLDKLPLLVANAPSKIRIESEVARSMPNMNTRGKVYIDDFEGSQNMPLSVTRSNWTTASLPDISTTREKPLTPGRLQWFNPWNRVKSKDIWPNKETAASENTVHVLSLAYGKPEDIPEDEAYAGVMTALYGSGLDMSRSRFIEIWARGSRGELKFDLGSISEDFYNKENPSSVFGDGFLNTEDEPIPGQGQGDGILTKEEDTGLDGVTDALEPGYGKNNSDPNNDNFGYKSGNKNDYTHINGTEGNASDGDRLGVPDTEDINRNGILDTKNTYYEYSISLEDPFDPYLVTDSVPSGDQYGWRLFRIPLWNNPDAEVGGTAPPDSTLIEFARMWVTNADTTVIQIASLEVVESSWLEQGIFNSEGEDLSNQSLDRIRITTANTHENKEYYPPPGVTAEIDRETKIRKKEQSLVLKTETLQSGNTAFVYRNFEKMDFTDYTSLKMFVHGPETGSFPEASAGESDVELVLRFGGDRQNYYEYRTKVYSGWDRKNEIDIDFLNCTNLKLLESYEQYLVNPDSLTAVSDTIGAKIYSIKGSPSLDNIKIMSLGVRNLDDSEPLDCSIWIDELRMDSLRDMTGTAARVNFNTDLAGFINMTGKVVKKSSDFHDMNAKKGTGKDNTELASTVSINLDRLTPKRYNLSFPVTASVGDNKSLPRLKSGSDIILKDNQKDEYMSSSGDRKFHVNFSKGVDNTLKGVSGTLIHWSLEKVNASYDWGEQSAISPATGSSATDNKQVKVGYDVDPKAKSFKPFNWLPELPIDLWEDLAGAEINYTPDQLNYQYTYDVISQLKSNIDGIADTTETKTTNEVANLGYSPFRSLKYNYTMNKNKDLYIDKEVKYIEDNKITYTAPTIFYITHNYNYSAKYEEDDNPKVNLASQLGYKSLKMNKSMSANGNFAWEKIIEVWSGKPRPPKMRIPRKPKKKVNWEENDDESEQDDTAEKPPVKPAPEKEKEVVKEKGTGLRTTIMLAVAKTMSPITFDYKKTAQMSFAGIKDRPGLTTRFGMGEIISPDLPDSSAVISRSNAENNADTYSARTKWSLPLDVGISASGKFGETEMISSSVSNRTKNSTFPEVNLDWTKVEDKIPYIDKVITNLSLTTGFSLVNTISWQNDSAKPTSDKTTKMYAPLISVNARVFEDIQTTFTMSKESEGSNELSGKTKNFTRSESNSTNTTIKYRLSSSKGYNLFGAFKLKSDIDMGLTFATKKAETFRSIGGENEAPITKDDSWTFTPKIDYRFSQKFHGGMQMDIKNSKDMRNKVHKVREVSIWGELQF